MRKKTSKKNAARENVIDAAASLVVVLYGAWQNLQNRKDFGSYAEALGLTEFNQFLGATTGEIWATDTWSHAVNQLHEVGLVNISGISPSDGLSAVNLSSYGCSLDGETLDILLDQIIERLTDSNTIATISPKATVLRYRPIFEDILASKINPKDSRTWLRSHTKSSL